MKINWGIIGAGDVCELKSGPAFYKCNGSALVAVARRDAGKAKDFACRHKVAHFYSSADELLADPQVNAVYIATPPQSHKELAIKALKSGRPVYVEKPMAMNYAECEEMMQAARESGQKLFVAFYRRAMPYFIKVKDIIDNGQIGKPVAVAVKQFRAPFSSDFEPDTQTWRVKGDIAGGGYFYDLAPHTIDILDYLLGKIADARGFTSNLGQLYEVEDTVSASLRFENGALGTGIWSFVTQEASNIDCIEILGTKGKVQFAAFDFTPIILTTSEGEQKFEIPNPAHVQQPLIQTVVDELLGRGTALSNAENGARAAWVMDKIFNKI